MSPAYIQALCAIAQEAENAGHGNKEPIYQRACTELKVSRAKLLTDLNKVSIKKKRKQRSDAGKVNLSREEALKIATILHEGKRKNHKKITSVKTGIEMLRNSGLITAAKVVDEETGEAQPLSDSAINRALRVYKLHPEQLDKAKPHVTMKTPHPNYLWQVDTSVCVIYYLPDGSTELLDVDKAVHYKNRPDHLAAIEQFRVIRYVLADHTTGLLAYRYYPHSESGENTVRFLSWAMAEKTNRNPFHGRPERIMVDGGATAGGLVKRFCQVMGIELIVNEAYNPRAKGSVEKGNDLIEKSFEQALKFLKPRPANFEQLNALADQYQVWWNATQIHSRHKKTRLNAWLMIKPDQLITTPPADILLSLVTEKPATPKVNGDLTIQYKNRFWDVSHIPNVMIGEKLTVHWHPFSTDSAMAVVYDDNGQETHIALSEKFKNEFGFFEDSPTIGKAFKSHGHTIADKHRKEIEQLSAGTSTVAETIKKRRDKTHIPFDGAVDPFKASRDPLPDFLPKRGTELELNVPKHELLRMNHVEMGKWLRGRLGAEFKAAILQELIKHYPSGMTEPELEQVLANLEAGKTATGKAQLKAV